jgi:serine acetyltransferase
MPIERVTLATIVHHARTDMAFILEQSGRDIDLVWPLRWLSSRPARAAMTMRLCGQTTGVPHLFWKEVLGNIFSCDVASGAKLGTPLYVPHPTGIVIGSGVVVKGRVALFQHVTLGRGVRQSYPIVEEDCFIFAGASVIGAVMITAGKRVKAHELIVEQRSAHTE